MTEVTDQMGRAVGVPNRPLRIISLVPSQTELLFDLGLRREVVGITRFCVHPAKLVESIERVGGTKQLKIDVIHRLQPDLIIGNKEENERDDILKLAESYPVWMSNVLTLADALNMIRVVGQLVTKARAADELAAQIAAAFTQLRPLTRPLRVCYFIWQKPFMVAGQNTFINDMLSRCGLENVFAAANGGRYPEVSAEELSAAKLDVILLSSEPFPFDAKYRTAFATQFPDVPVHLVDGEMFSWYGSRLLLAVGYVQSLLDTLESSGAGSGNAE